MTFITLGGCNTKKSIKYKIKFYDLSYQNAFFHIDNNYVDTGISIRASEIVKTYEEFILLCDENNSPDFVENSEKYNNKVNKLIRSFSEEYFESKASIICFGTGHAGGPLGKIKNILKEDDRLVINYKIKTQPQTTDLEHVPWILIIGVNQEDILDTNQVQLQFLKK